MRYDGVRFHVKEIEMSLAEGGDYCLIESTQKRQDLLFSSAICFDRQSCEGFFKGTDIFHTRDSVISGEKETLPDNVLVERIKVVAGHHVGDFKILSVVILRQEKQVCIGDEATLFAHAHHNKEETLIRLKIDLKMGEINILNAVATIVSDEALDWEN
jgi:hypothetical protein